MPRLDIGVGEARIDLHVELVDALGGRVPWRTDAVPDACLVSRHKITYGRYIRQRLRSCGCGHGQRSRPAGPAASFLTSFAVAASVFSISPRNRTSPARPASAIATALRNFDVSKATKASIILAMTHPPCLRLCPAYPGNPRSRIEGESPPDGKGHTACVAQYGNWVRRLIRWLRDKKAQT